MRPTAPAQGSTVADATGTAGPTRPGSHCAGAASPFPAWDAARVPVVTGEQMREVDRLMVEEFGISLLQMMENAGRSLAEVAIARFEPADVTVLAGRGNNGGGGMAAARHLANRGVDVAVVLAGPHPEPGTAAATQLRALQAMGVPTSDTPTSSTLVIDALVGYGLTGPLAGATGELAAWAADHGGAVLALDAPTGLDVTTGTASPGAIAATATVTLALPKPGLLGAPEVGELYLADISVPAAVYRRLGLEVPALFAQTQVIRLLETGSPHPAGRGTGPA